MATPPRLRGQTPHVPPTFDLVGPWDELAAELAKRGLDGFKAVLASKLRIARQQEANLRSILEALVAVTSAVSSAGIVELGDTVRSETSYGLSVNPGVSILASREDHTHGSPALSSVAPLPVGSAAVAGTGSLPSREDHVHRGLAALVYGATTKYGTLTWREEVPTGTVNGINDTFTLVAAPLFLLLGQEGVILTPGGEDYTLTAATIVYVAGKIPPTGMKHYARYIA